MADILLGMHRRIVEELASRLRALQRGDTTARRVVLLNAPRGEGKSRIIRALFEKLRAPNPGGPVPGPPPTTLPATPSTAPREVGWWQFDGQHLNSGVAHSLIAEARPQWRAQAPTLMRAWNEVSGQGEPGTQPAAPISTPASTPSDVPATGIALGHALRSLTHPRLPGVLVIEDMHLMGAKLAALVEEASVADPDQPLLVIGTVETGAPQHPEFARWVTSTRGRFETIDVVQLPAADLIVMLRKYAPRTDDATAMRAVARLGGPLQLTLWLTSAEMRHHIEQHEGAIDLDEVTLPVGIGAALATKWQELPEAVRTVLTCMVIAHPLAAVATPTPISTAASTLGSTAVSMAATTVTDTLAADGLAADGLVHIVPEVMTEAFAEFLGGALSTEQVRAAFTDAASSTGWCRTDGEVQYFRESLLAETAQAAAREELRRIHRLRGHDQHPTGAPDDATVAMPGQGGKSELRMIVRRHIERWIDETHDEYTLPETEATSVLARWYVALSIPPAPVPGPRGAQATAPAPTGALAAAQWRMACDAAERDDFTEAIARGRSARATLRQVLGENHPAEYLREQLAAGQAESAAPGKPTASIRPATSAEPSPPSQPQVAPEWAMQLVIAEWLGELGRPAESIDVLRTLLADMERHAGTRHLATLTVRCDLARQLSEVGIAEEAIGQFQAVIADLVAVTGPLSVETLEAKGGLAQALGISGQYDQAVAELRALIPLYLEVYGESHSSTFLVRGALAAFLSQSGQPLAAVEQARMLLEDQEQVLSANDPQLLTTRSNLAVMLLDSGDPDAAVDQFAQLATERAELLGATNLDTLDTRMNLAMALLEAGDPGAAVREFRATLGVMNKTLAPDHPSLLRGRGQLAEALGRSGDPRAAVVELRALERDVARTLGPRAGELALIEAAARYWERGGSVAS